MFDRYLKSITEDENMKIYISFSLIIYVICFTNLIPDSFKKMFKTPLLKVIVLASIAYLSTNNFEGALMLTIVYFAIINCLHKPENFENLFSIDDGIFSNNPSNQNYFDDPKYIDMLSGIKNFDDPQYIDMLSGIKNLEENKAANSILSSNDRNKLIGRNAIEGGDGIDEQDEIKGIKDTLCAPPSILENSQEKISNVVDIIKNNNISDAAVMIGTEILGIFDTSSGVEGFDPKTDNYTIIEKMDDTVVDTVVDTVDVDNEDNVENVENEDVQNRCISDKLLEVSKCAVNGLNVAGANKYNNNAFAPCAAAYGKYLNKKCKYTDSDGNCLDKENGVIMSQEDGAPLEDDEILSSYIKHNEQNIAMTTNINDIEVDDLFSSYNLNNIKKKFLYYDKIINEYDTNISSAYVDDNDLYYYKLPVVNDINADPINVSKDTMKSEIPFTN